MPRLLPGLITLFACCGLAAAADHAYRAEELAAGVVLFRPLDERSGTNSLVIERHDGLLVIDAQPSPAAARGLLSVIGKRWKKPVRYLALTHPHADAAGGVAAFPDTTLVITSSGCQVALTDEEYDFAAEMRLIAGESGWTEPARPEPTLILTAPTVLDDPDQPVQFRALTGGHSQGDMVVHVPRADVLYTGALFFPDGNPYAEGANISRWIGHLNSVLREGPKIVVGLRGPAGDLAAVRRQRDSLAWVHSEVEELFIDVRDTAEIETRVLARPEMARRFDLEASPSFAPLLVRQIIAESVNHREKRGEL